MTEISPPEKPTVLVIDDSNENLILVETILQDLEVRVETASSGSEGIRRAVAHPPDLVLLDIMMPELSGYDVCRILQGTPALLDIPILFLTALVERERELEGLKLGAVDYIQKPVRAASLLAKVANHLRLAHSKKEGKRAAHLAGSLAVAVTMSHELNNPLQGILGHCEVLLSSRPDLPPDARADLEKIRDLAHRMGSVVHRLTRLVVPVIEEYSPGVSMIDVSHSKTSDDLENPGGQAPAVPRPKPKA